MKYFITLIVVALIFSCKNDPKNETIDLKEEILDLQEGIPKSNSKTIDSFQINELDLKTNKSIAIKRKQEKLIKKKDERQELEKLIEEVTFLKETKDYTIDFTYPKMNEIIDQKNKNFNEYMEHYYVNITKTETDILESKELCDSILCNFREKRFINYKIYNVNDQLVSVLFYKENFYSGTLHPSYSFNCFNFDLNRGVFMHYGDFFTKDSEEELFTIINEEINKKIKSGNLYYDCWELSMEDFLKNKNNFVLNETVIEFYFDDCIICPSYTGTYSIQIQLVDLLSVLKKYDLNPLVI